MSTEACRWAFERMRTGGEPARPWRSTSQPRSRSTPWRAAARQVTWAIWQPVTKAKLASAGRSKRSFSQAPATSSTTAAAGAEA